MANKRANPVADEIVADEILADEMVDTVADQTADVTIRLGKVPAALPAPRHRTPFYEIEAEQCLFNLALIAGARYLVRQGREIIVERSTDANDDEVRAFLLGTNLGALLYQRDWLPLHGSAISTAHGTLLFMGASGAGKSTLAAAFHARGYRVLADDISVVRFTPTGYPYVAPGCTQLKLWADAAQKLGKAWSHQPQVRPTVRKYRFPTAQGQLDQPLAIHTIYHLQPAAIAKPIITPLSGMAKVTLIQDNAYRRHFALAMGKARLLFTQASALATHVKVCVVTRPRQSFGLDELVTVIEQDLSH